MENKKRLAKIIYRNAHKILQTCKSLPKTGDYFYQEIPKLKKFMLNIKQCFFDIEMLFSQNQIKCKAIQILSKEYSKYYKETLDAITDQDVDLQSYNDEHHGKNPNESFAFMLFSNRNFLDKTYFNLDEFIKKLEIFTNDTILEYISGNVEQSVSRSSQNYKKLSGKFINILSLNVDAYIEVFSIENYLRAYILVKYENKYKAKDLIELFKVNTKIQNKAYSRKSDDDKNGWTEPRGRTLLSYLDFDDLKILIIQNDNWLLFEKDFPSQDFIKIRLQELYQIRNKIAHNANITQQEFDMLKMYSTQIYTQLKKYDDEIKLIEL